MININSDFIINSNNRKLKELDYMRVIACMGVMIIHITATGVTDYFRGSMPNLIMVVLNRSLQYVTPLFIFLSGVTSFYGYKNKKIKYFYFLKKRLAKILIPYIVWCIIYYLAYINIGYYNFDIIHFIKSVIIGSMSYHLYFVIIIIQLYILGPVFYYSLKRVKWKIPLLIVSAILTALFIEYLRFKFSNRIFLKYMFFYMLGIYVSLEYEKYTSWLRKHSILLASAYAVLCLGYVLSYYYNLKIYSFMWFAFCSVSILFVNLIGLVLNDKLDKIYSFINLFGQSSYYIYLIHPLILTILIQITNNKGISVTDRLIIYSAIVIPVTIILSLSYTFIKNRFYIRPIKTNALESNN